VTAPDRDAGLLGVARAFPGAYEDHPWGDLVVKVNKKIFVFFGAADDGASTLTLKLGESRDHALSLPGAAPAGYGLGRAGWVTVPIGAGTADRALLRDWIEESYRLVAPKRLVAALGTRAAP
jgi:predicted DNA-binding protein (MmcQ/YjbR family)